MIYNKIQVKFEPKFVFLFDIIDYYNLSMLH